jgi:hypothetical protein
LHRRDADRRRQVAPFQIPARILPGSVLVISPLISLMKDQVDALVRMGFRAAMINSSLERDARQQSLALLRRGELELVTWRPRGWGRYAAHRRLPGEPGVVTRRTASATGGTISGPPIAGSRD